MEHTNSAVMEQHTVQMGARGRLVLPARVRERLGLREGDRLVLTVRPDGSLSLVSLRAQLSRLKGLYGHLVPPGRSIVAELIEERHEEARREDER